MLSSVKVRVLTFLLSGTFGFDLHYWLRALQASPSAYSVTMEVRKYERAADFIYEHESTYCRLVPRSLCIVLYLCIQVHLHTSEHNIQCSFEMSYSL